MLVPTRKKHFSGQVPRTPCGDWTITEPAVQVASSRYSLVASEHIFRIAIWMAAYSAMGLGEICNRRKKDLQITPVRSRYMGSGLKDALGRVLGLESSRQAGQMVALEQAFLWFKARVSLPVGIMVPALRNTVSVQCRNMDVHLRQIVTGIFDIFGIFMHILL